MTCRYYPGQGFHSGRCAWIACMLVIRLAAGATVHSVQEWSDGDPDGWRLLDQSTGLYHDDDLVVSGGGLAWSCRPGEHGLLTVEARATASGGKFSGDYFDVGSTALEFEFFSTTDTTIAVELWNESIMLSYTAEHDVVPGWQTIRLPLLPGIFLPWMGAPSAADVQALLQGITRLWISARPVAGDEEQTFQVRKLFLAGSGPGYGAWIQGYPGDPGDWLPANDWDGDGHSNAQEHVAGTAPNAADDVLFISWDPDAMALCWSSVEGREYAVWQTGDDLASVQQVSAWLPGTGADLYYPADMPAGSYGCVHYHVRVRRQPP